MALSRIPICSSDEIIRALERLGCYRSRAGKGSHQPFHRRVGDRILTGVVVLGRREVPKGTLRNILAQLEIPLEEFQEMR